MNDHVCPACAVPLKVLDYLSSPVLHCALCRREWTICWLHWQRDEIVLTDNEEQTCDKCCHSFCQTCYEFTFASTETCGTCFEG